MFLLDSDAAKKICQYHLLYELATALGCTLQEFAVLPQLKFQLKLADDGQALAKLGDIRAVELARQLIDAASEVEILAATANPIFEIRRPDIDSGELTLLAALHAQEHSLFISGDKRAFIALSKIDDMPVLDLLWTRFICLEEAMYRILQSEDFQHISEKVRAKPGVDMALSIIFGRVDPASQYDAMQAFKSYIHALTQNTNGKYFLRYS